MTITIDFFIVSSILKFDESFPSIESDFHPTLRLGSPLETREEEHRRDSGSSSEGNANEDVAPESIGIDFAN